jgi:UDP-3-O-[3-hydroxymyristoyl] glucosamine N-acyltransferase
MTQYTLSELARLIEAELVPARQLAGQAGAPRRGAVDGALRVRGCAALSDAGPDEVSFCGEARFLPELARTRAGAVVISRRLEALAPSCPTLLCEDAQRAITVLVQTFAAGAPRPALGVHESAVVHPTARLGRDVAIAELCSVGEGAELGDGVVLHAGAVVGAACKIGALTELFARVVLYPFTQLGSRVRVHAGAVLGADGFGYEKPTADGQVWNKIPQVGKVVVEDDVEIGANTTIDRARFGTTRIGAGCKLDNLVHVAHNVQLGPRTMVAAQAGIAGSTRIGADCLLGGQVGIGGHLEIGPGSQVAGQSGVFGSLPARSDVLGHPARPRRETLKQYARISRLEALERRLQQLEAERDRRQDPHQTP